MDDGSPSFKKTTVKEKVSIANLLNQKLINNGDGTFTYADGWNDQRIGDETIPDYPGNKVTAVSFVRKECFGDLKNLPKPSIEERLANLESSFAKLVSDIAKRDFINAKNFINAK